MTVKQLRPIYQIKVTLDNIKPPIWRRILVLGDIKLDSFHEVLQIAMGWTDSHLHMFMSNGTMYGASMDDDFEQDEEDESQYKLSQLLTQEKDSLLYEYDFGDGWRHKVVLEKILPYDTSTKLPSCIKGKRCCPPEDCGGVWGYLELQETISDTSHPEHDEMLEWLGNDFDAEHFDLEEINNSL